MNPTPVLLVVEDVADSRDLYRAMFELDGWRVLTAGTAEEALKLVQDYRPDAIVLDHSLGPGMTGMELAHILVDNNLIDGRRIIIVTGEDDLPDKPYDVRISKKPIESQNLGIVLGKLKGPGPLLTVYICGMSTTSLRVMKNMRDVVRDRPTVRVAVVDVISTANNNAFVPSVVVRYAENRWRFIINDDDLTAIEACLDYLIEVAL